ncbi:MAG: 6-phosphofructokinase [Firmicutes bacterium]|nr:6-phosphofructokinase [Bacillota bacterium]
MNILKTNCLVAQSGGPTAVINASVYGVIEKASKNKTINKVLGSNYGLEGILNKNLFDFSKENPAEIKRLKYTPAAALGSCRYKLKSHLKNPETYEKIFSVFKEFNIQYFFYIGGNDSMDTVKKLSDYALETGFEIQIIGVPKTIDNDLVGTDHSPGYGTAAKYIATSVMEVARDGSVYNNENIHIIEVMGRHTGWLAAASALANKDVINAPDLIYLPEVTFNLNSFIEDLTKVYKKKKKVNIVVSEGIKDVNGNFVYANESAGHDVFKHKQMGGVGDFLASYLKKEICDRVKVIELNVLQRASMHCVSKVDLDEAYSCGRDAVEFALAGETGKMVAIERINKHPYQSKTKLVPVNQVANREKKVPICWINKRGNYIKQKAIDYIFPLIQGKVDIPRENGLPRFAKLKYIL